MNTFFFFFSISISHAVFGTFLYTKSSFILNSNLSGPIFLFAKSDNALRPCGYMESQLDRSSLLEVTAPVGSGWGSLHSHRGGSPRRLTGPPWFSSPVGFHVRLSRFFQLPC